MQDGEVAPRRLVVPGGGSSEALEVVEEALDAVAKPVEASVQPRRFIPARVRMNDGQHPAGLRVLAYVIGVVARVRDDGGALAVLEEFVGYRRFVGLSWGEREVDWLTARRCDGVNFC